MLRGQMLTLRRQFLWPVLAVGGLDLVFMLAGTRYLGSSDNDFWAWWACWAWIIMLGADVYTLSWLGMWIGLVTKHPNRATSATIARVLVLPCGAWAGLIMLTSLTPVWHRVSDKVQFFIGLWFAVGVLADIYFCLRARLRLLGDLRTVATQRFVPGRALFAVRKARRRLANSAMSPPVPSET
jgi:hypothetical protein